MFSDRNIIETQHGVGGSENPQLGTSLLNLLDVDQDGVTRGCGYVGDIQTNQVLCMLLKKQII